MIDKHKSMELKLFKEGANQTELIEYLGGLNNEYFIMGIGNIVGWGETFVSELKELRVSG